MKRERGKKSARMLGRMKEQLHDVDLWRAAAAEFLATFIFLFIVCLTYMMPQFLESYDAPVQSSSSSVHYKSLQTCISIALTYATLIQCFENISGGHMNPAVSLAMVIAGHINAFKAFLYCVAQMTGAFSAVALCFGIFSDDVTRQRAVTRINKNLTPLQGCGVEFLQSLLLTITWLATYVTSKKHLGSSALPVGIAVLANSLWGGQLTGSSTNPARSIPTAALLNSWENQWVYAVGPLLGSVVGAILFSHVFVTTPKKKSGKTSRSGRNIEGESVKSDQDQTEQLPFNHQVETTNFSNPPQEIEMKTTSIRDLSQRPQYCCPAKPPTPSVSQHQLSNGSSSSFSRSCNYAMPQAQKLYRQSSMPAQRTLAMLPPLSYAPSHGTNSANVTLTRGSSGAVSRCSTACGSLTAKPMKNNSGFGPPVHNRSLSTSSGFRSATAMDPLLNDGAL